MNYSTHKSIALEEPDNKALGFSLSENNNSSASLIQNLPEFVNNVTGLISLPEIYLKIRELMQAKDSVLDDFSEVVSTDPNLAAAVLKIVNSAYFGFAGQIGNISRALNMIGIGQLHDLVLSISAVKSLSVVNEVEPLDCFWRRSIYCGVLSRLLAEKIHLKESDNLFIVGMLHEIGRLILFINYPAESQQVMQGLESGKKNVWQLEKAKFSVHYGQIGQELMKQWNLPSIFQNTAGHHPAPASATDYIVETAIVHIAHVFAFYKENEFESKLSYLDPQIWELIQLSVEDIVDVLPRVDPLSAEIERVIINN